MRAIQAIFVLSTLLISLVSSSLITTNLNDDWELKILQNPQAIANKLMQSVIKTSVPTNVHLDLLHQNKISDPFFGDNYPKLRWVSELKAKYIKKFTLNADSQILKKQYNHLVFEGIDTYAQVSFNGIPILKTQNAFRKYQIDVHYLLKIGQNIIEVQLESTKARDDQGQKKNRMPFAYAQTRKACYQYSWDWAPQINSMGIWKSVYLNSFDKMKIDYIWVRNRVLKQELAILNFAIKINLPNKNFQRKDKYKVAIKSGDKKYVQVDILGGEVYQDINIQNPKLWWPNGIGVPYIYHFTVQLYQDTNLIDTKNVDYGIKTVQLNRTNQIFTVKINGYPVYCKGANYVPLDMLYPRLVNPRYQTAYSMKQLIQDAVDSNYNMIRLWGGGQYQSDQFLRLCSEKGIMIFYDFMFSDSIYPSTQPFLENVQEEIKQQIRRARNYAALTLWSGNNQILQGILSWGWGQQNYKNDYNLLFQTLIPKIIEFQSPYIPYIPSSPVKGIGNGGFQRGGDVHYWGVWAGGANFQSYQNAVGPFNSEFGTQSFPLWQTILSFTNQTDRNYESSQFKAHERHGSQFSTLKRYMSTYSKPSINFEMQTYQSGLVQAFGVEIAIKAQRSSKPKSMGTLYWQFNDAWPAISWASIDYYGRWKPLQFMAKRSYQNLAIFYFKAKIVLINDNLYPVGAKINIQIKNFDGKVILNKTQSHALADNQVKTVMDFDTKLLQEMDNNVVLYTSVTLEDDPTYYMYSTHFFKYYKDLQLPEDAKLKVKYDESADKITFSSDKLIKSLFISSTMEYLKLSDNYFDLVPGHQITVQVKSAGGLKKFKQSLRYISYIQSYSQKPLQIQEI